LTSTYFYVGIDWIKAFDFQNLFLLKMSLTSSLFGNINNCSLCTNWYYLEHCLVFDIYPSRVWAYMVLEWIKSVFRIVIVIDDLDSQGLLLPSIAFNNRLNIMFINLVDSINRKLKRVHFVQCEGWSSFETVALFRNKFFECYGVFLKV